MDLPIRAIRRAILLGSFNRIYGVPGNAGNPASSSYRGNYGFILD